jgi:hypothetical protein
MNRNTTMCALAAFSVLAACATTRLNAQMPTREQRVRQLLAVETPNRAQLMALDSLQTLMIGTYQDLLASIAVDTTVAEQTRAHALMHLGQSFMFVPNAFARAITDKSVLIRTYAAQALRPLLAAGDSSVAKLLVLALHDPDERVQSKALESLADRDPGALERWLVERPGPSAQLRPVAQQFIDLAYDRGAPLRPMAGPVQGVLQRASNGVTIRYTPRDAWPQWDASVGTLAISEAGAAPIVVASNVEVVANVVPAFVSGDGKTLVYEDARMIHLRDFATGADRVIGPGIAPRTYPFTDNFVFVRQEAKPPVEDPRNGTQIFYEVLRMPFSGAGKPELIGQLTAGTKFSTRGSYSPARWMRVNELEGGFWLEGEGVSPFNLPDPFANTPRPKAKTKTKS